MPTKFADVKLDWTGQFSLDDLMIASTLATAPAAPAGRPRARTKQVQIVAAAWKLFMEFGFGGASMDAIAAAACVSKATLYAYFASKEDLFAHVIAKHGQRDPADPRALPALLSLPETLQIVAAGLARLILSADTVAAYRIIMSEGRNFPELGPRFYAAGPAQSIRHVAATLKAAMNRGALRPAPPDRAAVDFINLILGQLQLCALLYVGELPSARLREATTRDGVATFLRAYAPDGSAALISSRPVSNLEIGPESKTSRRSLSNERP